MRLRQNSLSLRHVLSSVRRYQSRRGRTKLHTWDINAKILIATRGPDHAESRFRTKPMKEEKRGDKEVLPH